MRPLNDFERENTTFLERLGLDYGYIQPTDVGLGNGIFDAVIPFRGFLERNGIHDYEAQARGGIRNAHKIQASFIGNDRAHDLPNASLYRAEERGDRRIWFPQVPQHFSGGETLLTLWLNGQFWLLNASRLVFSQSSALADVMKKHAPLPNLRAYLASIATSYDSQSHHSAGHVLLSRAREMLEPLIPGGLQVIASGREGTATSSPWIGILDPDEAATPEDGIYVVVMFKRDHEEVVLSLNQGVTASGKEMGTKASLPLLRAQAESLRQALASNLQGLDAEVDFGRDPQQTAHAAANIASITYSVADMPSEEQLREDLQRMLRLYQNAVWAKKNPMGNERPETGASVGGAGQLTQGDSVPKEFKPKDRQDYVVQIQGRQEWRRGDRHELLLAQYAEFAEKLGHQASNTRVHPRDLTLQVAGNEWLVEAKVVYNGNASQAARAAIGQLFEYSHFLYIPPVPSPRLMALFTEPLGRGFVSLFDALGIGVVWKGDNGWEGSDLAREAGLV